MLQRRSLACSALAHADSRNFTVINQSGYDVKFLAVSEPGHNDYSENELSGILKNGGSAPVVFSHADHGCSWTMKVTATDGTNVLFPAMNLCTINSVTLLYNKATNQPSIKTN